MKTKSPFKKIFRELILAKRINEPNDKTSGGLIIPENQRTKTLRAQVVHVGEVSPALDDAYLKCERALEFYSTQIINGLPRNQGLANSALDALRKARE